MKARIKYFLLYGLFWFVFFAFARLLFLIYHGDKTAELSIVDFLLLNLNGFRLDLATMGYFMIIPGLLFCLTSFLNGRILNSILIVYSSILLLLTTFLVVVDCELYGHWGFRLDATPLMYIGEKEAMASTDLSTTLLLLLLWIVIFSIFEIAYLRFYASRLKQIGKSNWQTAVVMLLLTGCLIAPIRGTVGIAPINTGTVYFHDTNLYANHAAVNVIFNTGYALSKLNKLHYPTSYYDAKKTKKYFQSLYPNHHNSTKTKKLIKGDQPNIVLIVLESYTFRFIEALGGRKGITPHIDRLLKEGILFDNFYASGDRTDKGIVAILNGYAAQPKTSIIKYPKKTQSLPFLNKDLQQMGYHSGFTYGGNIDFANFRSYLTNAQFGHITQSSDFPESLNTSKWGVHDQYVFDKFYQEADSIKKPFFKVVLTLSNHEPFEVPMKTVIEGNDQVHKFLNSAYYTDQCVGDFIAKAKQSDWWENSWIIITADHGQFIPDNPGLGNPNRFKIPMIWLGGALNKRDTVIHTYANQTDIPNTVLGQLGQYNPAYKFSNDILSTDYDDFAVFVFNNGFGYVDHNKQAVYDNTGKKYLSIKGIHSQKEKDLGKAYMQTLFNDFNTR